MKCPVCGYLYGSNKKQSEDLGEMLRKRDEKTRKLIQKVQRDIVKKVDIVEKEEKTDEKDKEE